MSSTSPDSRPGKVALIGAGPGDPDLLTLRALRLLERTDVLVYDNLVSPGVLALVNPQAERLYVGKKAGNHAVPQPDINTLLVSLARQGKHVVRLKGGDPFIFGRGGEEVEELVAAGVPFEVVPGITSASGAAAYAGIPLTHRDHAQSCLFVTGHLQDGTCGLDWPALVRPGQTLVIYMGISALPEISHQLIAHGMSPDTPAACIRHATLPDQLVIVNTLRGLPGALTEAGIKPPALLIVGSVVSLRQRLNWFDPTRD